MATSVCGVISFMWLHIIYQSFFISVYVKKEKKKEKKEKKKDKKKKKKIVYIFHRIILLRARVCTWHLATLSIYDGESLYVSSLPS